MSANAVIDVAARPTLLTAKRRTAMFRLVILYLNISHIMYAIRLANNNNSNGRRRRRQLRSCMKNLKR